MPDGACQPCGLDRFVALNIALFPVAGTRASGTASPMALAASSHLALVTPSPMALVTASCKAAGLAAGEEPCRVRAPGQRTAPAASPLRGRRLVSIAAYWRSVSDLLSAGEFPPI